MNKRRFKILFALITGVILLGFVIPNPQSIPVEGADLQDWNHNTFWYEPWGASGVHKGIDIFADVHTPVISSSYGIVLFKGQWGMGGKVVLILGPKWRLHYYAHLNEITTTWGSLVSPSKPIGTVGNSGNAKNKPSHLHYTILTLVPHPWRWDRSSQGWKKIFFLDPTSTLVN